MGQTISLLVISIVITMGIVWILYRLSRPKVKAVVTARPSAIPDIQPQSTKNQKPNPVKRLWNKIMGPK